MQTYNLDDVWPRYLFLDPASGKKKQPIKSIRARSAIVVCGTDPLGRVWVLDAWADRVGTNEICKEFVDKCELWGPSVAAFEDAGQQSLLSDPIMDEASRRERKLELPLVPIPVNTRVDKLFRIRAVLQPVIGSGRLFIWRNLHELVHELTSFPMSPVMDLVDALASCVDLVPPAPTKQGNYDERQELTQYLRDTGAPMHEIERVHQGGTGQLDTWWDELRGAMNGSTYDPYFDGDQNY